MLHFGFLATQIYRPWRINQWCAICTYSGGRFLMSCFSASKTVFAWVVKPILALTRKTWVSTAMFGWLSITEVTTFAVFLPTPGSFINSSTVRGTCPSKSSISIFAIPRRCLVFEFGYEILFIYGNTSSNPASLSLLGLGNRLKNAGVV